MASDFSRREFLERTALRARASPAWPPRCRRSTILAEAARRRAPQIRAAVAAQHPDRPLRDPDDGEPVVRPLLRLAAGRGRHPAPELPGPGDGAAGADPPLLDARHRRRPVQGLRPPRPGPRLGLGPRPAARRLPRRRTRATTSSRSPTTTGASSASSTRRRGSTRSTTATSARCSPRPGRTATTSGRRSRAAVKNNTPPVGTAGNQWETIFDRAIGRGRQRALLHTRTCPSRRSGAARGAAWTNPISRYYADCAAGTLPNISIVDPPFSDGGGGDGLSADEHPLGDVRLGQAFMADVVNAFVEVAQLPARRPVRHLRRVGRLLRPRAAAAACRTTARAPTCTRTSGRWASGSPPWRSRPYARGKRRSGATRFRVDHGHVRPRVDPEADLVPLRPRRPDASASARAQHRAQLRLGARRLRCRRRCRIRRRSPRAPCALGRRRRAATPSRRTRATWPPRGARRPLQRAGLRGQARRHLHAA